MPRLHLLMGAPGSGKSTFVKTVYDKNKEAWVSRDEVRFSIIGENDKYFSKEKEVFKEYVRRIDENLKNGFDVFADATHLNRASRRKLLHAVDLNLCSEVNVIWVKTPVEECVKRNFERTGTRSFVPEDQIYDMFYKIERPTFEEGFDIIYIVEDGQPIKVYRQNTSVLDETVIN